MAARARLRCGSVASPSSGGIEVEHHWLLAGILVGLHLCCGGGRSAVNPTNRGTRDNNVDDHHGRLIT